MQVTERRLKGVFEVRLEPREDRRGYFMRTYDEDLFKKHGIHRNWVQENHSMSVSKGVVRGMHFQHPPHAETKLVRAVRGEVFDAFVDLRKGSPTFGQWDRIILSEKNKTMVYIPRGFAHGFCTLTPDSEVLYKVDNCYAPQSEGTIRWNDPDLKIEWPIESPIISDKDANAPCFKDFVKKTGSLEVNEG
jgi:dTDP-4-dehydrorhamnose 3,5-epimerase